MAASFLRSQALWRASQGRAASGNEADGLARHGAGLPELGTLMSANEGVTSELIEHALKILRRHVCACIRFGIEPQIDRTIIEGVEDFRLAKERGEEWSVLAALSEDFADKLAAAWQTRYTQYEPPKADSA